MNAFFAVLLKILIVLGIGLGSIFAFVLLVLALVLFVPIRYNAKGSYQKESSPNFRATVSWLLHVVSFKASYTDKFEISLKIFGIKVKLGKSENDSADNSADNSADKNDALVKDNKVTSKIPDNFDADDDAFSVDLDFDEGKIDEFIKDDSSDGDASTQKKSTKTKIYDKIKRYVEIIQTDLFARCFEKCKDKLVKLIKHILPKRFQIDAIAGFDDPSITGKILAIHGMLIPIFGGHVSLVGDFENEVLDIKGKLKGHICVLKVLLIGASIYFDKRIRRLIKIFKKV